MVKNGRNNGEKVRAVGLEKKLGGTDMRERVLYCIPSSQLVPANYQLSQGASQPIGC